MLKMPLFMKGSLSKLTEAMTTGAYKDLDRIAWCYLTDSGKLAFVDADHSIKVIVGDNLKQIQVVDSLPSVDLAEKEVFYVLGTAVYLWNGSAYLPIINVEDLTNRIDALEQDSADYAQEITAIHAEGLNDYETFKEATTLDINNLSNALTNIQADVSSLDTRISATESDIAGLTERVSSSEGDISDMKLSIEQHGSDITSLYDSVNAIGDRVSSTESGITSLQSDVSTAQTDITTVQTDITTVQTDVNELHDQTQTNTEAINNINNELETSYYTAEDTDFAILTAIDNAMEIEDLG